MLEESDLRAILQYFYFTFLEPEKAREACRSLQVHAQSNLKQTDFSSRRRFYIQSSYVISKEMKKASRGESNLLFAHGQDWITPDGIEWGVWLQFLKEVRIEELHSLVWVSILGNTVSTVAESLKVNEGTVLYRLNQAHKSLGRVLSPEATQ